MNAVGAVMGGAARHLGPFLGAVTEIRPSWTIHVWTTAGAGGSGLPPGVQSHEVPQLSRARRLMWENTTLTHAIAEVRADALLNLTNSGPLRAPIPSLLYERNPLWFDPRWVDRMTGRDRAEARARRALAYAQARSAACVLVPSSAMAELLWHWPWWPRSTTIRVVPHAVDASRFAFSPAPWPPPADRPLRLLCVSHASRHKDQALLVELAERFKRRGTPVEVWLTIDRDDDPAYFDELHRSARSLAVQDQVLFLGRVPDPESLYSRADLVISSSITESFGFPMVEAMAAGRPVVASDIPASRELAGAVASFFCPGDASDALRVIDQMLDTPGDVIDERTRRGRARIERLSWHGNAAAVISAIEDSFG